MIQYIDSYIPEGSITIDHIFSEAAAKGMLPTAFSTPQEGVDFFKNTLALEQISFAGDLTEEQMLSDLLTRFIDTKMVASTAINLIIMIGDDQGNNQRMLNAGHYLQYVHGFCNADLIVLSGNHCANTEYAIILAETMLQCGNINNIIILNASKFCSHADRIVGTYGIHGDAAGMVYLTRLESPGINIIGNHSYTNGILYKAAVNDPMNSLVLCKNYLTCLSGFIIKFNIHPEDISTIIVQNANHLLISQCLQNVGLSPKLLYQENISKYGHLDSIDVILNLQSILYGNMNTGTRFFSFGTGWAGSNCCLYMQKT